MPKLPSLRQARVHLHYTCMIIIKLQLYYTKQNNFGASVILSSNYLHARKYVLIKAERFIVVAKSNYKCPGNPLCEDILQQAIFRFQWLKPGFHVVMLIVSIAGAQDRSAIKIYPGVHRFSQNSLHSSLYPVSFADDRVLLYSSRQSRRLVYVIGLHAVQFGNNWMKKNPRTAKIGRGQFGCQRNFLNPIISQLDKHVVLLLINYIASQSIQQKIFEVSPSRKPVGKLQLTIFRW